MFEAAQRSAGSRSEARPPGQMMNGDTAVRVAWDPGHRPDGHVLGDEIGAPRAFGPFDRQQAGPT